MRAKWDKWTARLPRLTRRGRIVRNLALALAVLIALPWLLEWPMWSTEAVFRQLEREALLTPSEIVLRKGDAFLTEGADWVTVGQVEEYDTAWKPFQKKMAYINNVLPKNGLVVAALPDVGHGTLTVAVTGLPQGTERGRLTITISGVEAPAPFTVDGEETFSDWGTVEEGWMFFHLTSHGDHDGLYHRCVMDHLWRELGLGRGLEQYPYTLELFDQDGQTMDLVSGRLPPDLRFLRSDW